MATIKNMSQLRERVLGTIDKLENGEIDIQEAACVAKLSEAVGTGLKHEMTYAILTNSVPNIPFLDNAKDAKLIEGKVETDPRKRLPDLGKKSRP